MSMSNLSTNDVSYIESKISIPKYLKNVKDTLTCDFDNVPIIYCDDEQENKNPLLEYIDFCDKENGNNSQNMRDFYYINNEDIKLKFNSFKKIKKEENEYNILDNYNIITETGPKTKSSQTFLLNKRNLLFKEKICNESYKIYKKFKLHENLLLFILIKKGEIKEKEKVEKKEKDKIIILLIKEKKKDKKDNKEEKEEEDEFGNDKNKNFIYCPDPHYHVFYKYYNFNFEIPQVGENVNCYLLNKNEKEEIILYFWRETKIYMFKIENINDESFEVITKYTFNLDFEPIFICPIKIIRENKFIFQKDIAYFTELFLVITKEKPKICKIFEEKGKLAICNAKYEFKRNVVKELFEGKNINEVEQLDNGLLAFHFKENKEKIAYFYLYSKDYFYKLFYKKMMFKIFLFNIKKKFNNNN